MKIDPRLNTIDDCLYRVAARAMIVQNDKVLLVQETPEMWWALPGGGVDHNETIGSSLTRELGEELGVPEIDISTDYKIAYYTIGNVVYSVPRLNVYFWVSVPEELVEKTSHVAKWGWFTKEEFLHIDMHPSFSKNELSSVIFSK